MLRYKDNIPFKIFLEEKQKAFVLNALLHVFNVLMCKELGNITMRMMKEHLSQTKKQNLYSPFSMA